MSTDNVNQVRQLLEDMGSGRSTGSRLVLNSTTGKLMAVSENEYTPEGHFIELTSEEANMFADTESTLIITQEEIKALLSRCASDNTAKTSLKLCSIDNADVFRCNASGTVRAVFYDTASLPCPIEHILDGLPSDSDIQILYDKETGSVKAFFKKGGACIQLNVIVPPIKEEIFSRINGIYETSVLADKKVAIIGLGSGGSPIALELAKQGVQHFLLIDPDRLETGNIARHICGMNDLGRFKTKAVSDMIKNKNPYADIITLEKDITKMSVAEKEQYFNDANLVICCTDGRESKLIVNRFCIEHNLTCLYGGAFRRAYGGQVLRVLPHQTMCYQCYISSMPNIAQDNEISNPRQAARVAYSDIPDIPIEPGLSVDIAPISTFMTKLSILELLKDCEHTMQSLYEDMEASLYFWFNRREPGTQWKEALSPLEYRTDQMSILRWYGVYAKANEQCPVCGRYLQDINPADTGLFG